jgi:uncharacterized protein YjbJ (UPF0337 family)
MAEREDALRRYDEPASGGRDTERVRVTETESTSTPTPGGTTREGRTEEGTEEIRVELGQTRAEMSETIDAIQDKLSPERLKEQAKETLRAATVGKAEEAVSSVVGKAEEMASSAGDTASGAGSTLVETLKQNPIPTALVGLGLGWLYMNRSSAGRTSYRGTGQSTVGGIASTVGEAAGRAQETAGQAVGSVGETARGAGSTVVETIKQHPVPAALAGLSLGWLYLNRPSGGQAPYQARSTVGETVGRAQERAGQLAGQAQESAGEVADRAQATAGQVAGRAQYTAGQVAERAQRQARSVQGQFRGMLQENPLAVGGAAAALGVAVGLGLPATRQEDRLMGQTRDSLMQQAQAVAQETQQKVQRVAEEAQTAAQREAQEQQLTE